MYQNHPTFLSIVGWNGGVREYHGVVSVDLDKNEVIDIQKVLS